MDKQNIILYSASWCAFCHAAKDYLESRGATFELRDIESDPKFAEEAMAKSGQRGIPVLDIDGQIIVGFDRPQIDAALSA